MPLFDDQGRLFGRINLIDAALVLLAVVLVPLAYGSWRLLNGPEPHIESVGPATVVAGREDQVVTVRGNALRPFLRADVGSQPAAFLFRTTEDAQVRLPVLEPGNYDIVFFDTYKEIGRFRNAVAVKPPPPPPGSIAPEFDELRLVVRFVTRPEILETAQRIQRRQSAEGAPPKPTVPILVSYQVTDELVGTTRYDVREGRMYVIKAVVRITAERTATGWRFNEFPVKAGALFKLNTESYVLDDGEILSLEVVDGGGNTAHGHA